MKRRDRVDRLVAAARETLGYRAQPFKTSAFGANAGYGGMQWDGALLEHIRRKAAFGGPNLTSSNAALAWFIRHNRFYLKPRPGDVAFFAFSVDGEFNQAHTGIVTAVHRFGFFRVIEGQVPSGTRNGNQLPEEVHERMRHLTDVIGFGRLPDTARREHGNPAAPPVRLGAIQSGNAGEIALVQTALSMVASLKDAHRGQWDTATSAAMWQFQRERGILHEHGKPEPRSLHMLAEETGVFNG